MSPATGAATMATMMSKLSGAALQVGLTALLALVLPAYYVYKLTTYCLGAVFPENVGGKVVLITGASSGIGEHLAYEYAKRGAYLALVARREMSLREVGDRALALGSPGVLVLPADVSKPDQCDKFMDDTIRYFGRLDHLVNNASIWQVCRFEEVEDVNHFGEVMDINFWGHVYPTRIAIPHLRKTHGGIVGVTSNSSYIFIGRNTSYNASKAAALNMYDTLRMELGSDIRITEVVPGVVESEITKGKMLTKEGEMKVDQDERDAMRTVVRDVCRGARYVFEPRWYTGVYLLQACLRRSWSGTPASSPSTLSVARPPPIRWGRGCSICRACAASCSRRHSGRRRSRTGEETGTDVVGRLNKLSE